MNDYEEAFAQYAQEMTLLSEERRDRRNKKSVNDYTDIDTTRYFGHPDAERLNDERLDDEHPDDEHPDDEYPDDEHPNDEHQSLFAGNPSDEPHRPKYYNGDIHDGAINEQWTGANGVDSLPWCKRPSTYWLLPVFFPVCIAFGGIMIPQTYLIQDLICKKLFSDRALRDHTLNIAPVVMGETNDQCGQDNEVQSRTAAFNLAMSFLSSVFTAVIAPYLGSLSDRNGRLKVIALPIFGSLLFELIIIIVGTHADTLSINWILLGAVIDGLCGSFTTVMALCSAYASDCTPPERRSVVFGHFHATMFAGSALGPFVAAAITKTTGKVVVLFYFALGCQVLFLLVLVFVIPESLSKERQKFAQEKHQKSFMSTPWWSKWIGFELLTPLKILWPKGEGSSLALRRNILVLALIDAMMFGSTLGIFQIVFIYARKRFGWNVVAASGFASVMNISKVLGLLVIIPLSTRCFRDQFPAQPAEHRGSDQFDTYIIRAGILFDLFGHLGYAIAPNGAVMVVAGVITSMASISPPTLQSCLTKHLPADRTGQILGASGLLHSLAKIWAPAIFNLIYSRTVQSNSEAVFYFVAASFGVIFSTSWILRSGLYLRDDPAFNHTSKTLAVRLE